MDCPTGKIRYDKIEHVFYNGIKRKKRHKRRDIYPYRCKTCNGFHLSSYVNPRQSNFREIVSMPRRSSPAREPVTIGDYLMQKGIDLYAIK